MNFKKRVSGSWTDTSHYIHNTSTDTITTLPAVLYPNAATATVELKGQAVQSTTPTHDNPVMPQGTGERTGNLFDKSTITMGHFAYLSGTSANNSYYCSDFIPIKAATYYFQNVIGGSYQNTVVVYDANKQGLRYAKLSGTTKVSGAITFQSGDAYIRVNCYYQTDVDTVMINEGSTPLPYEPYGYKIPISSASVTTPIYLGEVQATRKVKKLVLTGEETELNKNTSSDTNYLYWLRFPNEQSVLIGAQECVCTHLNYVNYAPSENIAISTTGTRIVYLNFGADIMDAQASGNTVAGLREYLAAQYANGTPVTVWYVLATPETAVVNEPLMKIGDYADTVSNISIPVTAGGDTISVGTTVQPSEVTVNYKGWHPVADVHERNSGAWT